MDAGKTIRKALLTAKSIAAGVGVRPAFARGGTPTPMSVEAWHGSDTQFDEFDPKLRGTVTGSTDSRRAHWLTGSLKRANEAAREANAVSDTNLPIVTRWRLDMRHPHVHDQPLRDLDPEESARVIALAKRRGHDAVVFPKGEDEGHPDYAVIDPKIATRLHGKGRYGYADGGGAQADMQPAEIQPRALNPMGLYSAAAEAARALPQKAGTAQQMIASLKGVKPDELKWSGVNERWKPTDKITRDDLAQHFEQNVPDVQESMLGDAPGLPDPRFKEYSTPGGTNYREKLLQYTPPPTPGEANKAALDALRKRVQARTGISDGWNLQRNMNDDELAEYRAIGERVRNSPYVMDPGPLHQSGHWPRHPNVVAHLRLSDRYEPVRAKPRPKFDTEFKYAKVGGDMATVKAWKTPTPGLVAHPSTDKGKRDIVVSHAPSGRAVQRGLDYQGAQDFAAHMGKIVPDWTQDADTVTAPFNIKPGETPETSNTPNLQRIKARNAVMEQVDERKKKKGADPVAKHALLLDELQSDWGQAAREHGIFKPSEHFSQPSGEHVREGPYIDNTQKWTDLGLKRALREAAEGGHTHLAWTPGEHHAERYKLSKKLSALTWRSDPKDVNTGYLEAYGHPGRGQRTIPRVFGQSMTAKDLGSHIGKDAAEKLLSQDPHFLHGMHYRELKGDGLSIGGRGMIGYYNNILPKRLLALAQEHDPAARLGTLKSKDKAVNGFPALAITPRMRESIVKRGFKAFAAGGAVDRGLAVCRALGGKVDHNPSEAQKAAGNYRKEHVNFHGLDVSIENKKGSTRRGKNANGTRWASALPADYGYIKRTEGADGGHVDCYIGAHPESTHVFIINQRDAKTKAFDEHKVMLGYTSEADAVRDYVKAFSDGRGSARMGGVQSVSMDAFKAWLKKGDTTKAARHDDIVVRALAARPA